MGKTILYSAVGMTDPISNFRDGSLLHICRIYKPDKVYILMSREVVRHHNEDNRYIYCLEKLSEKINHPFEIVTIQKDDLVEVQNYDVVYPIIKENIQSILDNMDESDSLIVNIGSGTPAMKYSLQMLSALADYNFTPINVNTPEKSSNPHMENQNKYDPAEMWELNEDNDDFVDRSFKTTSPLMLKDFYDNSLEKLIKNYNYAGVLTLVRSLNFYSDKLENLLVAANSRLQLNFGQAQRILQSFKFQMPFTDEKKKIFEYALALGVKIKNKNYGDYVRAITPLLFELNSLVLKTECGFNLADYTYSDPRDKNKIYWDKDKLSVTEFDNALNESYKNFNYGIVFNDNLRTLITYFLSKKNPQLYDTIDKLNKFEIKMRNKAAHTMISITSDSVKKETGQTPEETYTDLKKVFNLIHISTKDWDSYDKMNRFIINHL